jgi:type II secretory pathway pseudopilin PulG
MQISSLLIGIGFLIAAIAYVSRPFSEKRKKEAKANASAIQSEQREAVLAAIRDLDFDFKTGKVSEEDYQPLRAQLLVQAVQFVESKQKDDDQLEALIQSRRKTSSRQATCPSCGRKIVLGDAF